MIIFSFNNIKYLFYKVELAKILYSSDSDCLISVKVLCFFLFCSNMQNICKDIHFDIRSFFGVASHRILEKY